MVLFSLPTCDVAVKIHPLCWFQGLILSTKMSVLYLRHKSNHRSKWNRPQRSIRDTIFFLFCTALMWPKMTSCFVQNARQTLKNNGFPKWEVQNWNKHLKLFWTQFWRQNLRDANPVQDLQSFQASLWSLVRIWGLLGIKSLVFWMGLTCDENPWVRSRRPFQTFASHNLVNFGTQNKSDTNSATDGRKHHDSRLVSSGNCLFHKNSPLCAFSGESRNHFQRTVSWPFPWTKECWWKILSIPFKWRKWEKWVLSISNRNGKKVTGRGNLVKGSSVLLCTLCSLVKLLEQMTTSDRWRLCTLHTFLLRCLRGWSRWKSCISVQMRWPPFQTWGTQGRWRS